MEEEKLGIGKNIGIVGLDNVINSYSDVVEDKELKVGGDEREVGMNIINEGREMV